MAIFETPKKGSGCAMRYDEFRWDLGNSLGPGKFVGYPLHIFERCVILGVVDKVTLVET
jgi:hypothetical protein